MISHRNLISNVMQIHSAEAPYYKHLAKQRGAEYNEVVLGLLPFSHIYGLVVVVHSAIYEGCKIIVLPKFELKSYLQTIQDHRVERLYVVRLDSSRVYPRSSS